VAFLAIRHKIATASALVAGMTRIARWLALILALAITAVTLSPISFRPMTGAPPDAERAFAFAVLGGAIALCCFKRRTLIFSILSAVAFAALLEAGQNVVPGRHGQPHDFMIKGLAVILGAIAVWIFKTVYRHTDR
jgi:hypothetical protein